MTINPAARQHRQNVIAWLERNEFPLLYSTSHHQTNRCIIEPLDAEGFRDHCDEKMDSWNFKIKAHRPFGPVTAMRGWGERGRVRNGAQIIEHDHAGESHFELDFDMFRANSGALGAICHLGECVLNRLLKRKTNPVKVARARGFPVTETKEI